MASNQRDIDTTEQHMSVKEYAASRISTLRPPMAKVANPFKLLALLNTQQWLFFLVAFFAWSWDAFDFFTGTSSTIPELKVVCSSEPSQFP
jgi:SHS family lactate transporter-like MFS transporter